MIRVEAEHLIIDCPRAARWQRKRDVLTMGQAMGKGMLGFVLAIGPDIGLDDADLLLTAAPPGLDSVDDALGWLACINLEGTAPCRHAAS